MDIDAYTRAHHGEWQRVRELSRSRRLSGAQSDELIAGYQEGATDLSALRTTYGETSETTMLSVVLSQARMRFTRLRRNPLLSLREFFVEQLPAALYRVRWWTLIAALLTIGIGVFSYLWHMSNPAILQFYGTQANLQQYAEEDFINYYSEFSETEFAARVFTNNAFIAVQCIAFGITGLWPLVVIIQNAVGLGMSAAVLASFGHLDAFFLWIAPHGLLEMTMVFVAAGTGFAVFWSLIVPGPRTRMEALGRAGRTLVIVAVGTTIFLFISGLVEGFVTRQDWPWAVKIGIGALALASYLTYALVLGRRAHRAGHDGDLRESEAGYTRVHAD
ncbi:stage II sporulation protein M [Gulosibacter sp. 10]|uniref:stage II sporulation protein M n=1 Tax=Gulosibacter sp. 10 TaxID=1255570 RepID=UPI00097EB37C|nr:stage II sporulation protein M [Gulosibacter sp. 10]SJM54338.1 possible membrane protein [Gulosibacter sp. 10]